MNKEVVAAQQEGPTLEMKCKSSEALTIASRSPNLQFKNHKQKSKTKYQKSKIEKHVKIQK